MIEIIKCYECNNYVILLKEYKMQKKRKIGNNSKKIYIINKK